MTSNESTGNDDQNRIREMEQRILVLTAERDMLKQIIERGLSGENEVHSPEDKVLRAVRTMTPRMHASLQMLLLGWSNAKVASRLQVAESTAKVYMRGIMRKLGARNRHEASALTRKIIDEMPEDEYLAMTRIPKNWAEKYEDADRDPYRHLFEKTR